MRFELLDGGRLIGTLGMRPRLRRASSLRAPVTPWGTGSRTRAEMERLSANPRHFHLFLDAASPPTDASTASTAATVEARA